MKQQLLEQQVADLQAEIATLRENYNARAEIIATLRNRNFMQEATITALKEQIDIMKQAGGVA